MNIRKEAIINFFFFMIFIVLNFYNFHRYLFKYGSSEFTDGTNKGDYIATPIGWQIGKYLAIGGLLLAIYLLGDYEKKINKRIIIFYSILILIFVVNIISGLLYNKVINNSQGEIRTQFLNFDELEYIIWGFLLLPMAFYKNENFNSIRENIDKLLRYTIFFVNTANILVILNYFIDDVTPFHSYQGTLLIRFSGFWDDPNTFSIFCSFLIFYSIQKRLIFSTIFLFINIILAISFTGYILLLAIIFYFMIRNKKYLIIGIFCLALILIGIFLIFEVIEQVYDLKKGSLESHAAVMFDYAIIPFQQPLLFHETWLLSFNINYPPVSYLITLILLTYFIKVFLFEKITIQKMLFIVFFISSFSLPFLYMFPINFLALLFLMFYLKKIRF